MASMNAATSMDTTKINLDEVRKAHAILHRPEQQVEVRVLLKDGGAMNGRFDDDEKMIGWLEHADDPSVAVAWWSVQQLSPEPATNDLQHRKASTNDSVNLRNWLIVDVDPERESDPASKAELYLAGVKTNEVLDWLDTKGIVPRLVIMSGNGYHLYIATNGWPNDEDHNSVAKAFIVMLSAKFSDGNVKVDTATGNPGRLGKVPGCISRKGKELGDRAHRMVEIENAGDALALTAKSVEALVEAEGHSTQPARAPRKGAGLDPDFDIHDFAEWCGVTTEREFEKNGVTYYAVDPCPMAGDTHRGQLGKTCFIVGDSLGFECFSDDCNDYGIGDVLRKFNEENGRYEGPLFLEPDLSGRFPVDDIDDVVEPESEPQPSVMQRAPEAAAEPVSGIKEKDEPEPPAVEGEIFLTDLGNAKRFVKRCGNDIRYCFHTKKWYVWTGRRWAIDDKGTVTKKAKRVVQSILTEAAEIDDEETRKAYIQHERRSEAKNRVDAMVSFAQSEGDVPVRLDDFDANPMLLNTVGGTINLETGIIDIHRRSDMATKMSPVAHDPEAKCPIWERFLNQVTAGNKALQVT